MSSQSSGRSARKTSTSVGPAIVVISLVIVGLALNHFSAEPANVHHERVVRSLHAATVPATASQKMALHQRSLADSASRERQEADAAAAMSVKKNVSVTTVQNELNVAQQHLETTTGDARTNALEHVKNLEQKLLQEKREAKYASEEYQLQSDQARQAVAAQYATASSLPRQRARKDWTANELYSYSMRMRAPPAIADALKNDGIDGKTVCEHKEHLPGVLASIIGYCTTEQIVVTEDELTTYMVHLEVLCAQEVPWMDFWTLKTSCSSLGIVPLTGFFVVLFALTAGVDSFKSVLVRLVIWAITGPVLEWMWVELPHVLFAGHYEPLLRIPFVGQVAALSPPAIGSTLHWTIAMVSPGALTAWHALCWFDLNYWVAFWVTVCGLNKAVHEVQLLRQIINDPAQLNHFSPRLSIFVNLPVLFCMWVLAVADVHDTHTYMNISVADFVIYGCMVLKSVHTLIQPLGYFWRTSSNERTFLAGPSCKGVMTILLYAVPLIFNDRTLWDALVYVAIVWPVARALFFLKDCCVEVIACEIGGKQTHYELLGIERNSTADDAKKAYHKAAKKHHPDKNGNSAESTAMCQKLVEANETLQDPEKRTEYDRQINSEARSQEEILTKRSFANTIANVMYGRPATDTEFQQNGVQWALLYQSSRLARWFIGKKILY